MFEFGELLPRRFDPAFAPRFFRFSGKHAVVVRFRTNEPELAGVMRCKPILVHGVIARRRVPASDERLGLAIDDSFESFPKIRRLWLKAFLFAAVRVETSDTSASSALLPTPTWKAGVSLLTAPTRGAPG